MVVAPVPEYDELHVISDLHIGGIKGSQLFGSAPELSALIKSLRLSNTERRVALVINGDMVDFLSEPNTTRYFEPDHAVAKLDRMFDDEAFKPVWTELQALAGTPQRNLVIVLGNHDLELALPWVREHLISKLAGNDDAARGRIRLEFEGAGFRASVGGASVLCLHGNEVDTWNITDFEMLRRLGRDSTQGRSVPEWTPNAGTKMVIDVMNGIKKTFAFVDLLKPEVKAVIPILLALDQAQAARIQGVLAVAARLTWDKIRRATGFLSEGEEAAPTALDTQWLGGRDMPRETEPRAAAVAVLAPDQSDAKSLWKEAEAEFQAKTNPLSMVGDGALGSLDALRAQVHRKERYEVLYEKLNGIQKDRSFIRTDRDATCKLVDQYVSNDVDWLLTGHTHLERFVDRKQGGGTYINTGTWIPLIQLTPQIMASAGTFKQTYDVLESSRTIEALSQQQGLLKRDLTVASIEKQGGRTVGQLRHVTLDTNGQAQLNPLVPPAVKTR